MKPLVSIIIPTYGGNVSLKRAINSALDQDYSNFEIMVVDDNNPDTAERNVTEQIMKDYSNNIMIKYICHDQNRNGSAARNTGIKNSTGEYIAFLDDDDRFLPGKISKQVAYLEENKEYGAAYCWRYQNGEMISSELTGDLSASLLDLSFTPCTPSIMIRRSCVEFLHGFDESYRRHQDFEFLLRFYKYYKIGVVKEPLVEIIGNGVDNQPKAYKAVEIKHKFMQTFADEIDALERKNKGFKKRVYANHYSVLFLKLLRYGNFILAMQVAFCDGQKGGLLFWRQVAKEFKKIIIKRISK